MQLPHQLLCSSDVRVCVMCIMQYTVVDGPPKYGHVAIQLTACERQYDFYIPIFREHDCNSILSKRHLCFHARMHGKIEVGDKWQ